MISVGNLMLQPTKTWIFVAMARRRCQRVHRVSPRRWFSGRLVKAPWFSMAIQCELPSGKHTENYGKIHHFSWEHPLFLWPFSIAMLNYQRVMK